MLTIGIVATAAAAGNALAGADPFATLSSYRQPWLSLAPWGWLMVGLTYYLAVAVVVYRLLLARPRSRTALVLMVAILAANEGWNALLFAAREPWLACLGLAAFAVLVAVTIPAVRRHDVLGGRILLVYLLWVVFYDLPWMLGVAISNPR